MQTITIKDVAARAGVSVGTASRVLSGNRSTSPNSRERVLAAAAALDFRPNAQARSLRSTRTQTLGLLVSDVRNPFFAELAHSCEQAAQAAGYVTLLGNANERADQQDRYLETLISRRVDGVILAPQGDGSGSIADLVKRGIPTVFVDRTLAGFDVPSVTTDSGEGIQAAIDHLVGLGHRRIGYIAGPQSISTGRERLDAYTSALARHGLPSDSSLVYFGDFQIASGSAGATALLALADPPTAILAADSPMAAGAVATFHRAGIRIGKDVALVAVDDVEWFSLMKPPLSVISQNVHDMGGTAVDLLLQVIAGQRPASVVLPTELVIRDSSRRHVAERNLSSRNGNK